MYFIVFLISLLVGLIYRMRGGAYFQFGNGSYPSLFGYDSSGQFLYFNYGSTEAARIVLWALPITIITYFLTNNIISLSPLYFTSIYLTEFIFLFVNLLILNHGIYQSYGSQAMSGDSTFLTFWLPQYTMNDPMWYRVLIDFIGMTLVGAGRGALQSMPLTLISLKFLWLIPVSASMSIAYLIGTKIFPNGWGVLGVESGTEVSEFLTGLFYGLGLAFISLV